MADLSFERSSSPAWFELVINRKDPEDVNRHRYVTPLARGIEPLTESAKWRIGGVPFGADWDPTFESNRARNQRIGPHHGWGHVPMLIHMRDLSRPDT